MKKKTNEILRDKSIGHILNNDTFERTQRQFNPIETPLDSERSPLREFGNRTKKHRFNSKEAV